MVLGSNALEDLGFRIVTNDGTRVMPEEWHNLVNNVTLQIQGSH